MCVGHIEVTSTSCNTELDLIYPYVNLVTSRTQITRHLITLASVRCCWLDISVVYLSIS